MYCKNCGKMIPESDKFCGNCGAPIGHQINRERKEKAFWRYGWFTVLMLFMCFPVGVILIFVNHPGLVRTFFMFLFGLIVLGFIIVFIAMLVSELKIDPRKLILRKRINNFDTKMQNNDLDDGLENKNNEG